MIKNVMLGKDEGADRTDEEDSKSVGTFSSGIAGKSSKPNPVRPGMFLETVSKVFFLLIHDFNPIIFYWINLGMFISNG
ncbi:hypothetical protein HanOQP8_Chr08g0294151 [Helianthus annuus]|nr:hypothetical protein HanOQP8_Chr08g0294151 [Helianthus annuus]